MKVQCIVLITITIVSIAVSSSKACMKKVERNGEAGDNSLTVFFSTCGKYNACCSPGDQLITEALIVAPYKEDLAHNSSHFWVPLSHETVMNGSYERKLAYNYTCKTLPNACSNCRCCQEGLSLQEADLRDSPTIADLPDSYRERNELSEIVGGVFAVTILVLLLLTLPWIVKQLRVWVQTRERPPILAEDPEPGQHDRDPLIEPSPEPQDIVDPQAIRPSGHQPRFVSSSSSSSDDDDDESDTSWATGTTAFYVATGDETDFCNPPKSPKHKSVVEHHQTLRPGTNKEETREEEHCNGTEDPAPNFPDLLERKETGNDMSSTLTAPPQEVVDVPSAGGEKALLSPPVVDSFDLLSQDGRGGLTPVISVADTQDELNRNSTNSSPSAQSDGSSGSGTRSDDSRATGVPSNSDKESTKSKDTGVDSNSEPESTNSHVTGVDSDDQVSDISHVTGRSVASSLETGQGRSSPSSINSNSDSNPEQCNVSDEDRKLAVRQEAHTSSPSVDGNGSISPVSSEDNEPVDVSTTVKYM